MNCKRVTIQRTSILDYLKAVDTHPSAEEIHKSVKKNLPTISLATVYRTLKELEVCGDITKIKVYKKSRYDMGGHIHPHIICEKCNQIHDIFQDEINKSALDLADKTKFDVRDVKIIFYGSCRN